MSVRGRLGDSLPIDSRRLWPVVECRPCDVKAVLMLATSEIFPEVRRGSWLDSSLAFHALGSHKDKYSKTPRLTTCSTSHLCSCILMLYGNTALARLSSDPLLVLSHRAIEVLHRASIANPQARTYIL